MKMNAFTSATVNIYTINTIAENGNLTIKYETISIESYGLKIFISNKKNTKEKL